MRKTPANTLAVFGLAFGFLTMSGIPAMANEIVSANITPTCNQYTICISADQLVPGQSYTVTFSFTVTPTSGSPMSICNFVGFVGSADGTFSNCYQFPIGPLSGTNTFSNVTATLVGFNTVNIAFTPNTWIAEC